MKQRAAFVLSFAITAACSAWQAPPPPPSPPIPPPPLSSPLAVVSPAASVTSNPAAPTAPVTAPPPAPPRVSIDIETPYKLGERPEEKTREAYIASIRERRHWNTGGMGPLKVTPPGPEGHPDPRVIVDVDELRGPHDEKKVLRIARRYHWLNIVRCYRLGAYKDRQLRGWTKATMRIAKSGAVTSAKLIDTELGDGAVTACMVEKLTKLSFGKQGGASQVKVAMRVAPGDEPLPPPEELLVPGDGVLALDDMAAGVRKGLPAFERCYRAAFDYAPGLWGRLLVRFHLTDRGVLDEAFEAGSRFPDARTRQCLLHAARKLAFPRPKGGDIRFVVPLRLYSGRSAHRLPGPRSAPRNAKGGNPR